MSEIDLAPLHAELEHYSMFGPSGLLPALHAAQKIYGWLPEEVAAEVARSLRVPLADIHGVIEFYSLFYNKPVGKRIIRICTDSGRSGPVARCSSGVRTRRRTSAPACATLSPSSPSCRSKAVREWPSSRKPTG